MTLVLLALWAMVCGVDLVSGPQLLLSRPLVTGAGAGVLLGDPVAGLAVGSVLELFALEVVPIGASRYPDFAAPTAAGVLLAAGQAPATGLGLAVGLALVLAVASRATMDWVRRRNARVVQALDERLLAGEPAVVARAQLLGLAQDAIRALLLGGAGIAAALGLAGVGPMPATLGSALTAVAVAGGAAAALTGAVRTISQGGRWPWLVSGVAGGVLLAVFR